jgi:[ribosomal protein S18]-alanine N-acetyltransferase
MMHSGPSAIRVRRAGPADAGLLAGVHAACFARNWDASAFTPFLAAPSCLALLASEPDAVPHGLLVTRLAADEAELLTLGVVPASRRQGAARALLTSAIGELRRCGAKRLLLEVEDGNEAALGLYRSLGATAVGRRPHYYAHGAGATIFSLAL